ncbi:MAG: chemotaxis response regulator protein-glutamate methylesterase [Planctomycetota bacterium]
MRLLIVEDSALYRQMIRHILRDEPGISIVGIARNGREALEKIDELDPDVLTLDVQMPELDGIGVLREINRRGLRTKAIMLSSLTTEGAQVTTDALFEGAFDFILKPSGRDSDANRAELLASLTEKLAALREAGRRGPSREQRIPPRPSSRGASVQSRAIVIGVSTGGPPALKKILPTLPGDLPVPVLVVQHMPAKYTGALARRLNDVCALEVCEAEDGMEAKAGRVLLAPGGRQMGIDRKSKRLIASITDDPPENGCRPAVDYLLRSAVAALRGDILAVILTGMGRDGLEGARLVKRHGGRVFAQHPHGCTVYGMPKAVIEDGIADRVLPLGRMGPGILNHVQKDRAR